MCFITWICRRVNCSKLASFLLLVFNVETRLYFNYRFILHKPLSFILFSCFLAYFSLSSFVVVNRCLQSPIQPPSFKPGSCRILTSHMWTFYFHNFFFLDYVSPVSTYVSPNVNTCRVSKLFFWIFISSLSKEFHIVLSTFLIDNLSLLFWYKSVYENRILIYHSIRKIKWFEC